MILEVMRGLFSKQNSEEKEIRQMMDSVIVSDRALEEFRNFTKENNKKNDEMLINKLRRDWLVGYQAKRKCKSFYGNLVMFGTELEDGKVLIRRIWNRKGNYTYDVDIELKEKINKYIDIK